MSTGEPDPTPTPDPAEAREGVVVPALVPLASAVTKDGHLLLARLPVGAAVLCDWATGVTADITSWFTDLALIGWSDMNEAAETGRPAPADSVEVATLRLVPEHAAAATSVTYVHLPTRDAVEVPLAQALAFAGRGIAVQVTAGVAAEAAQDLPDTPAAAHD